MQFLCMIKYYLFLSLLLLSACAIRHNVPLTSKPNISVPPSTTIAFVDQNGDFYPNNWNQVYGKPPRNGKRNAYSLSKLAKEKELLHELTEFEATYLKSLAKEVKAKRRVFVLIHGYNANARATTATYKRLQGKMNISSSDEVIQFYWDGLYTTNPFSGMKTWFNATEYSQFAGKFALRKILNSMKNKDIYLISHSRGASVVLSALSTFAIDSTELKNSVENHHLDTLSKQVVLADHGNRIHAIMLAPAIGKSDFIVKNEKQDSIGLIRFTPQLKDMHITVNATDMMLKKFFGFLSNKLQPTDLGYSELVYKDMSTSYSFMRMTDFTGLKSHEFNKYIADAKFNTILKTYKLKKP